MPALLQVTALYCNIRTTLLLATVSFTVLLQAGADIEQRHRKGIKPLDTMPEDKPRIQLVLLEDDNPPYRQARLEEAALRYRYGLCQVGPWYYWTDAILMFFSKK